ncbi:uncharacterized protein EAE98_009258 [Botrytis deweyae]|uniref:Uncharacterized protein n=1 Tax=Botrytis deweyae TaxID=2478750 RepID=A0ABQ7IC21_9HELO|nr:uncharacterized protein EAE98_009258 [Botrytis deweyae]KAF7919418.1 hypothetical protein EAE98_009258 [Botrytis deweyae]
MPFQIPETKAEQNVYAFRPHLLALPQSQKVSSHGLLGKEGKEGKEKEMERVKGWKQRQKQKRPTPQENDQKAFHLRTNLKFVTMQIWVKVKSCYIHATDNHF